MNSRLELLMRLDWRSLSPIERGAQFTQFINLLDSNFVRRLQSRPEPDETLKNFLRRTPDFHLLVDLMNHASGRADPQAFQIFRNFCRHCEIFHIDEDSEHKKIHICFCQEAFYDRRFNYFIHMLYFFSKMSQNEHMRRHRIEANDNALGDASDKISGSWTSRPSISTRETLCLQWAAEGKTLIETCEILCVAEDELKGDIVSLVSKLNANNKIHAVAKATRLNII